jgi:hypothetical protein
MSMPARTASDTTTNVTATTPSGRRRKRSLVRKHHGRRQAALTTTTPAPKTTVDPGTPPRVNGRVPEVSKEMYTISVEPALQAGQTYSLDIPFTGLLKESLYGFYRSSYKDENGIKMYVLLHLINT